MNLENNKLKNLLWIIPALVAFIIALIPTLKYPWPLSWDVMFHVILASVYAQHGFVFTNPLINVPYGGSIGYPPLFHFLLAGMGGLFNADYFQAARLLQPFLAMLLVLTVSYVARRFYGTIAGLSAGFLMLSSILLGSRLIYPLPENLALIFLPLSVYFYYYSIKEKSFKYALLAGFLLIFTLLIHQVVPIILFLLITVFTLLELIAYRNVKVLKNYGAFLLLPLVALVLGVGILSALFPDTFSHFTSNIFMEIEQVIISSTNNQPLNLVSYGKLGILTIAFGIIGAFFALKRREKKDVYILAWIILVLVLINANLFGVDILSFRLLAYLLIPLSILAGFGLSRAYQELEGYQRFSSLKFRNAFLASMFILATFCGVLTMDSPQIAYSGVSNQYGYIQTAPPTSSMVEMADWFQANGNRNKSVLTNNPFVGIFLTAETGMPLSGDDYGEFTNNNTLEKYFKEIGIGYVVIDKRLTFQSNNGTFYRVKYDGAIYPLFYYSGDIDSNLNETLPSFVTVVFQNQDFLVCQIN